MRAGSYQYDFDLREDDVPGASLGGRNPKSWELLNCNGGCSAELQSVTAGSLRLCSNISK